MRLDAGGTRELHWHQAAEWGYMTYGNCRVTVMDNEGRAYVADVKQGDLWYFPVGYPHSLQGLGADGWEFILCFDSFIPSFSDVVSGCYGPSDPLTGCRRLSSRLPRRALAQLPHVRSYF